MADTPKTVAEALQEAIRSCDVKRDHNYRMGADSFPITTAEYAALRALSTQVAQRDEARELLWKLLSHPSNDPQDAHWDAEHQWFLTPRQWIEREARVFLQRAGARKADGTATRRVSGPDEVGSGTPVNAGDSLTAPSAPSVERDAARWRAATRIGWPEYCPHWEGAPRGDGWYHALTGERRFDTANAAIDAAMKNAK